MSDTGKRKLILTTATVALAAVFVGGYFAIAALVTTSDEGRIRTVVEDFYYAVGTGDGATACDLLADETLVSEGLCWDVILEMSGDDATEAFREVEAGRVRIDGDEAFVALRPDGGADLVRRDGRWLIYRETLGAWVRP